MRQRRKEAKKQSHKIEILREERDFLALNKPSGLVVHPDGKTKEAALTDWILKKYPRLKNVGEPLVLNHESKGLNYEPEKENSNSSSRNSKFTTHTSSIILRPGIVHRLDRETSGVILIAKNKRSYAVFKKQFQRHSIKKVYHAFVHGAFPTPEGLIDRPIGRSATDFRRRSAGRGARGELRDAVTYYRVIKASPSVSYVEILPQTGRTHQIRVHFQAIGHPVVGDVLYAPHLPRLLGFTRTALHASELQFSDFSGKRVSVEAPLPRDFAHALKIFPKAAP